MADVPVGNVPSPVTTAVPVKPTNPAVVAREQRAAKLAKVSAGLTKLGSDAAQAPAPAKPEMLASEKPPEPAKPAEPKVEAQLEQPAEPEKPKLDDAKSDEKKDLEAKPVDDQPDEKTAKALAQIDKQAKRFREEQAAAKRAFDQEMADGRAELARMKAELSSTAASLDELKRQAKRDPIAVLRKLGIESEDEWELVGRGAFPHTKTGKADPRSATALAQTQKERELAERFERIERENAEMREQLTTSQKKAEAQRVVEQWTSAAVKAIPSDKPTLIARLHAKSPEKARNALLFLGGELERANDGETPSHEDVIAEFERRERAELEDRGVDVDALLRPTTAAPAKAAPKTLDLEAPKGGTRPINGNPSRAERLAAVSAGLKKLQTETP